MSSCQLYLIISLFKVIHVLVQKKKKMINILVYKMPEHLAISNGLKISATLRSDTRQSDISKTWAMKHLN